MPADAPILTRSFVLVTVAALAVFVGFGATIPILPDYVENELAGSRTMVGIVFGAISITAVAVRPFAGRWGDERGRRPLMVGGAALVALGTALHALAPNVEILILWRLLIGAGQGLFFVGAATLVNDLAPAERRGEAASYFSVAVYMGLGVGPVLGETLREGYGFTGAWLAAAALCGLGALLGTLVPEGLRSSTASSLPRRAENGLNRLMHPAGRRPGLVLLLGVMPYAAFAAYVPGHAADIGLDGAGTIFVVYAACVLSVRVLGARLPDRLGIRVTGPTALITIAVGMATMWAAPNALGLHLAAAIYAFGQALLYPALLATAVNNSDDSERTRVVATFTMFFDLANGFGGLVIGLVAGLTSRSGTFLAGSLSALLGLAALAVLIRSLDAERDPLPRSSLPSPG